MFRTSGHYDPAKSIWEYCVAGALGNGIVYHTSSATSHLGMKWNCRRRRSTPPKQSIPLTRTEGDTGPIAKLSSQYGHYAAHYGIDGNRGTMAHTHTESYPWWQMDLGMEQWVWKITFLNRPDVCASRLFEPYDTGCRWTHRHGTWSHAAEFCVVPSGLHSMGCLHPNYMWKRCKWDKRPRTDHTYWINCELAGRYVGVTLPGNHRLLNFNEFTVYR